LSVFVASFILLAMLCFLVITAVKAWKYSRYPIHSRLELYPVPKEGAGRAEYGGSYFEDPEWWQKPRPLNHAGELKDMLGEMLLIRLLFKNNRSLWWISYAFHLGIYVLFGWTLLLLLATLWPAEWLVLFTGIVGALGYALATLGALFLLVRRLFDSTLRVYTTPQEYFNLALISAVLITGAASWTCFANVFDVTRDLLFFSGAALAPLVVCHLVLLGIMLIYIPIGKMSHYVGKYFTFHKVLWDNDPNHEGSDVEARLKKSAALPKPAAGAAWAAAHIAPPVVAAEEVVEAEVEACALEAEPESCALEPQPEACALEPQAEACALEPQPEACALEPQPNACPLDNSDSSAKESD